MSHGYAIARTRVRRRPPRPPRWRWRAFMCGAMGLIAVIWIAAGWMPAGAGFALLCASDWRQLARWQEDSAAEPLTDATRIALDVGGAALIISGWFA